MKTHQLTFPPTAETFTILEGGRGRVTKIILSHRLESTQTVTFYDREGVQIAQYMVHPSNCPCTIVFRNEDIFSFSNGLKVNAEGCALNLEVVY